MVCDINPPTRPNKVLQSITNICSLNSPLHEPYDAQHFMLSAGKVHYEGGLYVIWILPPLSNSWRINILWLYIALNRTPSLGCHWVGAVPNM